MANELFEKSIDILKERQSKNYSEQDILIKATSILNEAIPEIARKRIALESEWRDLEEAINLLEKERRK